MGVVYGVGDNSNERIFDEGVFIPIDRIYAESLKQGYDWAPASLRPVPAPLGIDEETVDGDPTVPPYIDTLTVKASFDKALFSPTLFYRADLLKAGVATPFDTCYVTISERSDLGYEGHSAKNIGEHSNCEVSEESRTSSSSMSRFTVVVVSFTGRSTSTAGSFTVRLKGCMEHLPNKDRCGDYGSDGSQTLTLVVRSRSHSAPGEPPPTKRLAALESGGDTHTSTWALPKGTNRRPIAFGVGALAMWAPQAHSPSTQVRTGRKRERLTNSRMEQNRWM